jgi:kynurenine formamidase
MPIIDCAQTIEPHFHWQSHSFVSQDPGRGDEFQEYGLKWRGSGFSFVSAPGWRIAGALRLDAYPLEAIAGVATVLDATGPWIMPDDLRPHLANPHQRKLLILRTSHADRHRNSHLAYWREVPVFDAGLATLIASAGYVHVVLDIPCDPVTPRRPLFDGDIPNPNFAFRAALHAAGLLVTENAMNLSSIAQAEVFLLSLPLAMPRATTSPCRPVAFTDWPKDNPRMLDVSTPLFNHWRWFIDVNDADPATRIDRDEIHFTVRGHGFTHCDAPRHMRRDGLTMQQLPNEGLDVFTGRTKIIDLSDLPMPTPLTPEIISARAGVIQPGDMVVLRSDLTNRMGYESHTWHLAAPNLEVAAANWLLDQGPKAIVIDFPQDHVAREMPYRHVYNSEFVTHHAVFNRNVPFVEDLRDIGLWGSDSPYLLAVPLRTNCIDGAMMRTLLVDW